MDVSSRSAHTPADCTPKAPDVFADGYVKNWHSGAVDLASSSSQGLEASGSLLDLAMSPEGRYVAFSTDAANLASTDTDGYGDVFLRDRSMSQTTEISAGPASAPLGSSEGDPASRGDAVAYSSRSPTLVTGDTNREADVFVWTP